MLDYLPAIIAMGAVILGVRGGTWDHRRRGWKRITKIGWLSLSIGFGACVVSLIRTTLADRELAWQERQKQEVRAIAEGELTESLQHLLFPFEILCNEISDDFKDVPPYQGSFYGGDPEFRRKWLTNTAVMSHFDHYDLNHRPPRYYDDGTWGYLFHKCATESLSSIERTLEKYSMYLDADVMTDLKRLEKHEFTELTLVLNMKAHLNPDENHQTPISGLFFGPRGQEPYVDFIEFTHRLLARLHFPKWRQETAEKIKQYYKRREPTTPTQSSMQPTAGRRTISLCVIQTRPLESTLAVASGD